MKTIPYGDKIDYKRQLKPLYTGKVGTIQVVTPGALSYLCCHGAGDPNTSLDYKRAVEALFSISYQLKFETRRRGGRDYAVMPLEGLWWSEKMEDFVTANKANWQWTMMIFQPPFITTEQVDDARASVVKRRGGDLRAVELSTYDEGNCVQTLHVGPFSEEGPAISVLHARIASDGHQLAGKHHEIYLTDIRRAVPARWKTIIRQPFR